MEPVTTYDRVLSELRHAILRGEHAPGTRLRQFDLAARYRSSRIPLREALRTLEAEGLVVNQANRGATVAAIDIADLAELYVFRVALERVTARAAAARRVDLRPRIAVWREEAEAAVRRGTIEPIIAADAAFHGAIAQAAGNRHVCAALESRWAHVARAMRLYLRAGVHRDVVWDEHAEIAEAIVAGDQDLAETLVAAHVQQSGDVVLSRLGNGQA
jgi:DNA-binding GntR family transcriptional regulator